LKLGTIPDGNYFHVGSTSLLLLYITIDSCTRLVFFKKSFMLVFGKNKTGELVKMYLIEGK